MRQTLFCISSFITGYLERYRFYDMYIVMERYICVYIYILQLTPIDRRKNSKDRQSRSVSSNAI